jgi:2-polyprenyl-3-methyl-5-hydroxy-6-metoxy-1,4-benzoquinol methylase
MSNYKIVTDREYGFKRVDPIPTKMEVEKFYREEFYSANYERFNDSAREVQEEEKEFNHARYDEILTISSKAIGALKGKSLFDIGCGFGELLRYCSEKGMNCAGLEVAPESVEELRGEGFEVYLSDIESDYSVVGDNRYDIVTMLNVLEHLREPARILYHIRENLLKPGGVLVVDVPNEFSVFQELAVKEHNLEEWWIASPAHINYFSCDTLSSTLEGCGYDVIDSISSFPLEMFLLMGDVYVGNSQLGKACHNKRVAFEAVFHKYGKDEALRDFYRALASVNLGRQVVCYAQPNPYTIKEKAETLGE